MQKNSQIKLLSENLRRDVNKTAHELADISAAAILPLFRNTFAVSKAEGRYDPVTEADKGAEAAMREHIMARFPEHGIIGEEFPAHRPEAAFQWILDPIDGTRGFVAGMPCWGTLIGLMHEGAPVFGMMNQPFVGERFFGDGESAFWQRGDAEKVAIRVSPTDSLDQALMGCTTPDMFTEGEGERFQALHAAVRDTRYGTDCYGYALLAAGRLQLVCEADLKPFDIMPMVPVIEGAGGVVSTWTGEHPGKGGRIIASASEMLHRAALTRLQQ